MFLHLSAAAIYIEDRSSGNLFLNFDINLDTGFRTVKARPYSTNAAFISLFEHNT
jgi:hypothetical protein